MTEAEWLTATDPGAMLKVLGPKAGCRKLRLFAAACARRSFGWLSREPRALEVVRVAELLADGLASRADLQKARRALSGLRSVPVGLAWTARAKPADAAVLWAQCRSVGSPERNAGVLREIFGNPFRLIAFSTEWRTDTAVSLAHTMYESREFGAMPILADALQDAGCDNSDILTHCRDTSLTHVRGCWVVDLVLGKE
jgi:hypothetical protein